MLLLLISKLLSFLNLGLATTELTQTPSEVTDKTTADPSDSMYDIIGMSSSTVTILGRDQ